MYRVQQTKKQREEKGVTSALAVALLFILAIVVYAFIQIVLVMGGASETRNAVDSGALNVGKDVFNFRLLKEKADLMSDERQFIDVSDSKQKFSLTNVNRMWGQSLLVALNVQAMENEGTSTGSAKDHADKLFKSAKKLSDRLADKLNDANNLYPIFNNISQQNHTNMLGHDCTVISNPGNEWRTSLVDRGAQSNIKITKEQLPGMADSNVIGAVQGNDGNSYIPGYKPIKVLDQYYNFVPFKTGERPHLIDRNTFDTNTNGANKIEEWEKPIPNAFSVEGKSLNEEKAGQKAISFVQANPQRQFALEIPYGFIKVHLKGNHVVYQINSERMEEDYDYYPTITAKGPFRAGAGSIEALTFLGMEYLPPNLYQAIYAIEAADDHKKLTSTLLQRCREIKQNCSQGDLFAALNFCPIIPGIDDYVVFRIKDTMIALPFPMAIQKALELVDFSITPDGSETDIAEEFAFFFPNFTFPVLVPDPAAVPIPFFFGTFEFGTETWTPGSGYNGCLGELSIERTTQVYDFGTNVKVI